MNNRDLLINSRLQLEQVSFLQRLVDGLVEDGVLENASGTDGFQLSPIIQDNIEDSTLSSSTLRLISDFFLFRQIVIQLISTYDKLKDYNLSGLKFSESLDKFIEGGFVGQSKNDAIPTLRKISQILDNVDTIKKVHSDHTSQLENITANLNPFIIDVLTSFTARSAAKVFSFRDIATGAGLGTSKGTIIAVDVLVNIADDRKIFLDVKFRRRTSQGLKESLFQLYENLQQARHLRKIAIVSCGLVIFTDEDEAKHDATRRKFEQMAKELFPDSYSQFILFIIPIFKLNDLQYQLEDWSASSQIIQFQTKMFMDKPTIVGEVNKETFSPDFLFGAKGSISVWVESYAASHYLKSKMNNRYVVAHATDNFQPRENEWQNVFALSLSPDNYKGVPSNVFWRLWTSDDDRLENRNSIVLKNASNKWYHLFVRWSSWDSKLEFFVDGKIVAINNPYEHNWPKRTEGKMVIGSWGNNFDVHLLGLPIYRLQTSSSFLSDSWLRNELEKKPSISLLV